MRGTRLAARLALAVVLSGTVMATSAAQEAIKIDGSTGVAPLIAALAKAYQPRAPGVAIEIGGGLGGKERIEALSAGRIAIAIASHGLKVDELTRSGMAVVEIARTPVVFAVNAGVTVANLSDDQVCAIYSGRHANWRELGGPDLAIAARTRPDSEVDAEVVRDGVACLKDLKMPESVKIMRRSGDMAAELASAPGAFGMTTTTVVEQSGGKVRALALNGVSPDAANVVAGKYRLVREAFLVTKRPPAAEVERFIAFVRSADGAAVITANGAIPTPR
ncbi:MAG TPA: substrate-binding domain-containing protein [Alphaproteobacteria bacterium]|nr:substrate-binding domain-containing protein [Alphaproteobacteria bacterium]